jgi:hypothetical protein
VAEKRVSHMVVSCRVIGMGIDDALAHSLSDRFGPLVYAYADSGRNLAAHSFLRVRAPGADLTEGPVTLDGVGAPAHVRLSNDRALVSPGT